MDIIILSDSLLQLFKNIIRDLVNLIFQSVFELSNLKNWPKNINTK